MVETDQTIKTGNLAGLYLSMQLREVIELCTSELGKIYDPAESAAITELVIEKVSGMSRTERSLKRDIVFNENEIIQLKTYLQRLSQHEPVQYVLHEAWFCGLKFYVDDRVLIPRPETEELVEWIIADCKFPIDELSILDVGTGSGCIPISLKRRIRKAVVSAIDISTGALEVAKKNAEVLGAHVNFYEIDFLNIDQRDSLGTYDIIVSNPPYIPEKDRTTLASNVSEFEPATALFVPSQDPVIFYKVLAGFGKKHLNAEGKVYAEVHEEFYGEAMEAFVLDGYRVEMKKDMQGKERMIKAVI